MIKRVLDIPLTFTWFDEIASGRKGTEYRKGTPRWKKRIAKHKVGDILRARRGYTKTVYNTEIIGIRHITGSDMPETEKSFLKVTDDEPVIAIDVKLKL